MEPSYEDIAASKPFCFQIGPELRPFYVHQAVVEHYSKPLSRNMHNGMKETVEQVINMQEVDEDTFIRFVQFLYTGDYVPAEYSMDGPHAKEETIEPSIMYAEPPVDTVEDETVEDFFSYSPSSRRKRDKKSEPSPDQTLRSKKAQAWEKFKQFRHGDFFDHIKRNLRHIARPYENYTEVLLSHAKLYAFAEEWDIDKLRSVSVCKLHLTLVNFEYLDERIGDITALLRYVFDNTPERKEQPDEMRSLLVEYVSCNVEKFIRDEKVRQLLYEQGTFACDLMDVLH